MTTQETHKFQHKITNLQQLEHDTELVESLAYLSKFYPAENDAEARRDLLGLMEKQTLQTHRAFLNSFQVVHQQLGQVEGAIRQMRATCNEMVANLEHTKSSSSEVIHQTEILQHNRQIAREKQQMARKYLEKFQLTEKERKLLSGHSDGDVDTSKTLPIEFFQALQRVQEIHNNTKQYLACYPNAEITIKDSLSLTQQAAFDRLFRWVQLQFRENGVLQQASPEISRELTLALRALSDRPVLLKNCVDGIIGSRSNAVLECFMIALQRGGPNGVPKPIEIHAHDPHRYVGDMLACLHQLVADEYELLQHLFFGDEPQNSNNSSSLENINNNIVSPVGTGSPTRGTNTVEGVLSAIFVSVIQPFEVRFEQVLSSRPGLVVVFRLANLLDFYHRTIFKFLANTPDAPLLVTILRLKQSSLSEFENILQLDANNIRKAPPLPPADLSPPAIVHQSISKLSEIMTVFDSSLVPAEERTREFAPILHALLSPLLDTCNISATSLVGESNVALFLTNCLALIESALSVFEFASSRAEEIQGQIEAHMNTLVVEEAQSLLNRSKLGAKFDIFHDWNHEDLATRKPLSYVPQMDARQLGEAMRSFEETLLDISTMTMPQCDRLLSTRLKAKTRRDVFKLITSWYENLYNAVLNPENKYDSHSIIVPYTPHQLQTMLGIAS